MNPKALFANLMLCGALYGQSAASALTDKGTLPAPAVSQSAAASPSPLPAHPRPQLNRFSRRAALHYNLVWGVDELSLKYVESGEIIRFAYRVVDAQKAKALNDKKAEPSLVDLNAGVKLVIPELEKVGKLRQSSTPVAGKVYWMAFSNKGRRVKRGARVSVIIGNFRADGLIVD